LNAIEIREHLICDGFLRGYSISKWHNKLIDFQTTSQPEHVLDSTMEDRLEEDRLKDMIHEG